eukprot:11683947-Alexandrium_andersonii.AAC.1
MAGRKHSAACAANRESYTLAKDMKKVLGAVLGGLAFPLWVYIAPTGFVLLMLGVIVERAALLL